MSPYQIIASTDEATVVSDYSPDQSGRAQSYQSEAELERELLRLLESQGYEYLPISSEADLIANLRRQLEQLNHYTFSASEWQRFFSEKLAKSNEGMREKTVKIQQDPVQNLTRDDGSTKNITLLDKRAIHNNRLQVINQYQQQAGAHPTRYDVSVLVNGLPLVHVELKRRGVAIREAFNQIRRYQRESFWEASGLFEYTQIFVISNGTHTKYYSNSTRAQHLQPQARPGQSEERGGSHSFEFTSFWADATNRIIPDLTDFARTFFARHTLLNVLTKYCVYTTQEELLVMRPYQIAATERVLGRIKTASANHLAGRLAAGGYIWHTTGSGKTLTSFKTAQLASEMPEVDKVLFVVDRKDLDYQTVKEYDRFEKGAADGNTSTRVLQRQLEDRDARGNPHEYRILVTTIQKLDNFVRANRVHPIYKKRVVLIFDECHRSQFGQMHSAITHAFRGYFIFGFTGTPIFAVNAGLGGNPALRTTEQAFGDKLHTYTIVNAINDGNVLPFRIDYVNTLKASDHIRDRMVQAIDSEEALMDERRIRAVTEYVLEHFDQKTMRASSYTFRARWEERDGYGGRYKEYSQVRRQNGFNAILAVGSIPMAMRYYREFKHQQAESADKLKVATIFSFNANEEEPEGLLPDESFDTDRLDRSSREFLDEAIADYNALFSTNFSTAADSFENYYRDLSWKMKNRDIDLLIVVNMFLTGFDATPLNTLWVDKNLRLHGLMQAFSRTNRILNSIKTFGNIVCFRDLKEKTDEAIALFGDSDARGIVLLKTFDEYYNGYEENGEHQPGYTERIEDLRAIYPLGEPIVGEEAGKGLIRLFGAVLRLRNILSAFDEFPGREILSERDFQDYQSVYIDTYDKLRNKDGVERESIVEDLVFELELMRQLEVNIDYILMLVEKYHASHCQDKSILVSIEKAVGASLTLRSKKELIENFLDQVNVEGKVDEHWRAFVRENREKDLKRVIDEEALNAADTARLVENAFRDGFLKSTGTDLDGVLPPVSRFAGGKRAEVKRRVLAKLQAFFEKYQGVVEARGG